MSARVKRVTSHGLPYGVEFKCPGCDDIHRLPTGASPNAWGFNENFDHPSLTPSILVRWRACDPTDPAAKAVESTCHSFVTDGRIEFLPDCTHALAGQTVDLSIIAEESTSP